MCDKGLDSKLHNVSNFHVSAFIICAVSNIHTLSKNNNYITEIHRDCYLHAVHLHLILVAMQQPAAANQEFSLQIVSYKYALIDIT